MPDRFTPSRRHETWLTLPSLLWMAVFFAVPALNLFLISFRPAEVSGDVGLGWTTDAWRVFAEPGYQEVLLRTLGISLATMAGCVLLALPASWFILRAAPSSRPWLLLALVLPFWTSFLVRVFSWRALLQSSGPVATLLTELGLLEDGGMLLYNPYVVVLVMIYTCLPLAVLPLHAAMEKFDFGTYEAARDLGAGPLRAFWSVVVPSVRGGIVAACLLVGVPSLGSYVVPEMVGGVDAEMLGSKIGQRLFSDRNLPQAAALASGLALVAMPLVWLSLRRRKEELS